MNYRESLTASMTWLGQQPNTVFIGQGVRYPGHGLFATLEGVPMEKRIEFPVAENMQLGVSIGMALTGKVVVSIFPRMDFLLCATDMLVNHLDKLESFTHGQYKAKVIIRVGIGSTSPLDPGCQHCGDYTTPLNNMLRHIHVARLTKSQDIVTAYQYAYKAGNSSLIVEEMSLYGMD